MTAPAVRVIGPGRGPDDGWRALWRARELTVFLAWRDIRSRYRQTALGLGWAVVQPVLNMTVFWLVFGRMAEVQAGRVSYPLFALVALVAWQCFANTVTLAGNSLVNAQSLLTKVAFPRLALPVSALLVALVDLAVGLGVAGTALLVAGAWPAPGPLLALPLAVALVALIGLGVGVWAAALLLRVRDLKHVLPFAVQLLMFASPVGYPRSRVPVEWLAWYDLNPMCGALELFRWTLLGGDAPSARLVATALAAGLLLAATGGWMFRRMAHRVADLA